ncbi:MAG: nitrile hydratase subunit beta [Pseudomonadales bacterium]
MDGVHDLGGRYGFGAVAPEADEPVFHERWEARVFAAVAAAGAGGLTANTDQFRHAIERIDPVAYLTHGYYGRWLAGLETLLLESGWLDEGEWRRRLAERGVEYGRPPAARPSARPDRVAPDHGGSSARRPLDVAPRFRVGDRVRTRSLPSPGHTRLPAYARGREGEVVSHHGGWVYPDAHAHGRGDCPQHLYTVAFRGETLWGEAAEPGTRLHLDLFEPYLESA